MKLIMRTISDIGAKIYLWIFCNFFTFIIMITLSRKRKRMSHDNGIGAIGKVTIVKNQEFPAHDFFVPGRVFDVKIRHASATFLDDAMNCIRSMSIKFSKEEFKSPFDLEMNTGEISLFWSAWSFFKFAQMRREKFGIEYPDYYKKYPEGLRGAKLALRRNPDSFHDLRYYAKTPFQFMGTDKIKRYAKYRIKPFENIKETGIEDRYCNRNVCNQRVLSYETRGRNYLKDEYVERVKKQEVKYMLQIQVRMAHDDENPEIFNNMLPWPEELFPWHDLAVLDIERTLDWEASTRMGFSLNNMPKTLGYIPAKSIYDYNSLNYMRAHSEWARKARMLSYKFRKFPKEIPNNDDRNSEDWTKIQKVKHANLLRS